MNLNRIFLSGWLVFLSFQLDAQCSQSFKVLHYTETTGYDHNTRSYSQSMFEGMGLVENFEVVTDNSGAQFSSIDSLNQYAAVIFSNTSGNSGLDSTQRENFKAYMLNGGGFLGIHAAGDAYRHSYANGNNTGVWDWYPENLTGASVRIGPSHTHWSHVDTLFKASPVHPSLNNIPDPWIKQEEFYYWADGYLDTTFTPILGVNTTGTDYYDVTRMMAQIKELPGGGRAFYTGLGHAPVNYTSDTIFQRLILDALLWVSELNLPSSLEVSVIANQLPCSAIGDASVVSLDSTQVLSYSWSTGDTTASVTGLVPGVYSVTVTSAAGCSQTDSVMIQSNSEISPQLSVLNEISCFNDANASIEVTLPGGIEDYHILWSTGDTTGIISGIGAGDYSVIISDSSGCSGKDSLSLMEPSQLIATASAPVALDCFGASTGTIKVIGTGGTGVYTYSWSNGATTKKQFLMAAGSYTGTITDANGCTDTDNISLANPPQLSATASVVNTIDCFGQTGSASVAGAGGTGALSILWSNGSTSATPGNLAAGSYSVTITDANGCTATDNISLVNPSQLSATASVVNTIDCFGQTGSASVAGTGGTGALSILWSNGSTSATPGNLSAGSYSVTITDANGCTATDNISLANPPQLSAGASVVNTIDCFGQTGSATVSGVGGTGALSILWSNGSTSATPGNLSAGSYSVTVTDANGCTATDNISLANPPQLSATASVVNTIDCFGQTGSASVAGTGGTGVLSILWSNGSTSATPGNLSAGSYSVTVTDANGCTATENISLANPPQLSATASVVNTIDCFGQTGSASVSGVGGTGALSILWSNGSTSATPGNLSAGSYSVTVTDANGCTATENISLANPPQLIATASVVNTIDCFGQTGSASVAGTGGTGVLSILWSNGSTSATPGNLAAGSYSVTITDANGCTATENISLANPPQLSATASVVNTIDCFGQTGSASVSGVGGTGALSILWSNGSTSATPGNLSAGSYSVTVTDANGCTATENISLANPPQLSATASVVNTIDCFGQTGSASVSGVGGTGALSILWSNGSTSATPGNLAAGSYSVTITDANGCTATDNITLSEPSEMISSITISQQVDCSNMGGELSVAISGGSPGYMILWENGDTTLVRDSLGAGTYVALITDLNGCSVSDTIDLPSNTPILASLATGQEILCFGDSTGEIILQVSGGQAPYAINWDDGDSALVKSGLGSGTYTVLIEDGMGCVAIDSIVISSPDKLEPTVNLIQPISCFGAGDAVVEVSVSGGTGQSSFVWSTGDTTSQLTNQSVGTISVMVNDSAGCLANGELFIPQPDSLILSTQVIADSSCSTPAGEISITPQGGTAPYQAMITLMGTGGTQTDSTGALAFTALEHGEYLLSISDANGCEVKDSVEVADACEQQDRLEDMMGIESWILSRSADKKFIMVDVTFLQPKPTVLSVRDIHGRLISELHFPDGRNINEQIPSSSLAKGVYLIQLTTPDASAIRKLVIR